MPDWCNGDAESLYFYRMPMMPRLSFQAWERLENPCHMKAHDAEDLTPLLHATSIYAVETVVGVIMIWRRNLGGVLISRVS